MMPHYSHPVNVYVHGMYQSGQWTCPPDRVVLIVGSGVGTAGEGGKRVSLVAVTSIVVKSLMWAGFKRSSDITSCLPWTSTVKVLAPSWLPYEDHGTVVAESGVLYPVVQKRGCSERDCYSWKVSVACDEHWPAVRCGNHHHPLTIPELYHYGIRICIAKGN